MVAAMTSTLRVESIPKRKATIPATCGVDIDVPEMMLVLEPILK
jgi:hypothetical protein